MQKVITEWYDFPNVRSTKMLTFLFGSRGLRPDLPSPFGQKFLFCLLNFGENEAIGHLAGTKLQPAEELGNDYENDFLSEHSFAPPISRIYYTYYIYILYVIRTSSTR